MCRSFFFLLISCWLILVSATCTATTVPVWLWGIDASYVSRVEAKGGIYRDSRNNQTDLFHLLSNGYGADYVRLRVWHSPDEAYCDQPDMLQLARRANQAGLKILLDIHYSDSWADPSQQPPPKDWQSMDGEELHQAVYHYSRELIHTMQAQGTEPEMVQIGNEILNGILWPYGQLDWSQPKHPNQWQQLASLLKAAIAGIRSTGANPKIVLHIHDAGKDNQQGRFFFDRLQSLAVPFDAIAISWYPLWHGSFTKLSYNIRDLKARYQRPIYVAETSYPWTLRWYDRTHNPAGLTKHLLTSYPATEKG